MKCLECGEELNGARGTCFCTREDDNPCEMTATDVAAYERYKERVEANYQWGTK